MGELKIQYSDKKVTPFGGMKLYNEPQNESVKNSVSATKSNT